MGHCAVLVCQQRDTSPSTRPALLKWLLSLLVCCWSSKLSRTSGDSDSGSSDGVELGPMTLREYISTLEPYDPEVHGWRGEGPPRRPPQPPPLPPLRVNGIARSPQCAYTSTSYQPRRRDSPCPRPRRGLVV